MVYEIKWTVIASKQFARLDKSIQKRIIDKLESIRDNPFFYATKLVGFDAYKIRVGDHRIMSTSITRVFFSMPSMVDRGFVLAEDG